MGTMLAKVAATNHDRMVVLEFWEWLGASGYSDKEINDINPDKALDDYFGIDARMLEAEREKCLRELRGN